ncbi:GAF domain-containing protein [Streptomyces sp. NPDC127084]|uniref:GAF domain-containing protein n=1 Tax=Streptomyces sp. NPDC127084 TaxID=3347133 RepID=UPI003647DD05
MHPAPSTLLTPDDRYAFARAARLREIGIGEAPVQEFDDFAHRLALTLGARYAMVNFIDDNRQYFAGLYSPTAGQMVQLAPQQDQMDRVMARDHGYCPHVVVRRKALILEDVCDYPRFAGNPVVDELGIRSYAGAPLLDRKTGMALGTICVVDTDVQPWGRQGLQTIKAMAQQMADRVHHIESGLQH